MSQAAQVNKLITGGVPLDELANAMLVGRAITEANATFYILTQGQWDEAEIHVATSHGFACPFDHFAVFTGMPQKSTYDNFNSLLAEVKSRFAGCMGLLPFETFDELSAYILSTRILSKQKIVIMQSQLHPDADSSHEYSIMYPETEMYICSPQEFCRRIAVDIIMSLEEAQEKLPQQFPDTEIEFRLTDISVPVRVGDSVRINIKLLDEPLILEVINTYYDPDKGWYVKVFVSSSRFPAYFQLVQDADTTIRSVGYATLIQKD